MPAPGKSKANSSSRNKTTRAEKASKKQPQTATTKAQIDITIKRTSELPIELQQLLLNIFKDSFPEGFGSGLEIVLQEVKGHLFRREFDKAFGRDDYLEAYALRWSPSRALAYTEILWETMKTFKEGDDDGKEQKRGDTVKVACLGGGAGAEIVSLAGVSKMLLDRDSIFEEKDDQKEEVPSVNFDIRLVDMANWSTITSILRTHLTTPPPISKYANAALKMRNKALVTASAFNASFHQHDLLSLSARQLEDLLKDRDLITLFFTLNELYTTSLPKTHSFIQAMTSYVKAGTLLLVVDSAGSYSTVALPEKEEKKYPMHWLLDHTLISSEDESNRKWTKLKEDESRWFRTPEGLKYQLELENMRYQTHLYRRNSVA